MFLNPDKEDLIYGIVYFLISAPQVPFYVLVILVAIVVIIISLSPPTAYFATSGAFAFKPPGWFFDNQAPYASIFNNCAFAGFMISLGISYISYITIVVLIIATKRHMSVSNRKEEISILLPYTIVILYISGGLVYWYAVTENVDLSNRTSQVIANIVWVTGGYWTPTFLVVFHRSIRSGIWNSADGMLCGMKSTNIANVFYVG
uniref:Serpentine receptor class gamma n=1 Tax=Caenorhabditis japonica TaxID=281687 RepID=A0A8R1HLJ4_CAEJA